MSRGQVAQYAPGRANYTVAPGVNARLKCPSLLEQRVRVHAGEPQPLGRQEQTVIELRIVGPQFGDPYLFVSWLHERYGVRPITQAIGEHDRYLELSLSSEIHVLSAAPAHWKLEDVYEKLLARADAILLMLNRIQELRRLNSEIINLVRSHSLRLGVTPIVLANDPHGGNPKFPAASAREVARELDDPWPVLESTIGPFELPLRWSIGAELAWQRVLVAAGALTA